MNDGKDSDGPYEKAAKLAVEGHPLPGEDPDTRYLDDADHWIVVYSELLDFKVTLLRQLNESVQHMEPEGVEEISRTDAIVLQAEADRFRKRLAMWRRRREELAAQVPS